MGMAANIRFDTYIIYGDRGNVNVVAGCP